MMYTPDFKRILNNYTQLINKELIDYLPSAEDGQRSVVKAMKYSLSNGGKRLRPVLVLEFCKACGGDIHSAVPFACAIEYIHTYSLIHDDLPCMDDDDMRRGNPSCHKMFGEATALLAGDALLTHAFDIVNDSEVDAKKKCEAVSLLAQNAGVGGMIGGQVLDLAYEKFEPSLSEIITVHKLKTGALIAAACLLGCIAAGATQEQIKAASGFAYYLGVAFQIKDDLLDMYGDEEKLGKPVGSDAENSKTTYVTIAGKEKSEKDIASLTEKAITKLDYFNNTDFLKKLCEYLCSRES